MDSWIGNNVRICENVRVRDPLRARPTGTSGASGRPPYPTTLASRTRQPEPEPQPEPGPEPDT
jgi:hypothetical protein